jgi:hypothetical protein
VTADAPSPDVETVLGGHRIGAFNGSQVACSCDRKWRKESEWRSHLAAALRGAGLPEPSGEYRCGRCRDGEHHRCAEPGTCRCTINPDTGQEATP